MLLLVNWETQFDDDGKSRARMIIIKELSMLPW